MKQSLKNGKPSKGTTTVTKGHHTINKQGKANERKRAEFPTKNGQPIVDLIEWCQWACDELIAIAGRATQALAA